ncbi:MAG TPA: class I SAM-dependent methyltransferase [Dehalococcoidia bacterium]
MLILAGTKVVEAPQDWHAAINAGDGGLVVDVGSGDGRWAYENARADPSRTYVALDPDAGSLREYAFKAARKPSRGGITNAVFVVASVETPPYELDGAADQIAVIFPWAALLRGILLPEMAVIDGLARMAKDGAALTLVLTYDATHDHGAGLADALPSLDEASLDRLHAPYAAAGLDVESVRRVPRDEALAIPSTWGRRLLHGRAREVFEVRGVIRKRGRRV